MTVTPFSRTFRGWPSSLPQTLFGRLHDALGSINAARVGRNRRGGVILHRIDWEREDDGCLSITLRFDRAPGAWFSVGGRRLQIHRHCDHSRLLNKVGRWAARSR